MVSEQELRTQAVLFHFMTLAHSFYEYYFFRIIEFYMIKDFENFFNLW